MGATSILASAIVIAVLGSMSAPAHAQDSACLYQGVLVTRPLDWCQRNAQATIALSQLSNPSPQDSAKALQMLLVGAGYNPGPIDGAIGPQTRAAMRDFQRNTGLPATGDLDAVAIGRLAQVAQDRTRAWIAANSATINSQPPPSSESDKHLQRDAAIYGARVATRVASESGAAIKGIIALGGLVVAALFALLKFLGSKGDNKS